MSSSADGVGTALDAAAGRVLDAVAEASRQSAALIVLIDGRSGSGKTSLAARLRERWPGVVQVIALDDIYPGWDGLAAGADAALVDIIEPVRAGAAARWRRWDWHRSAPGDLVDADPDVPLIIEGSGIITPASAPLAPIRVWLESPSAGRRERALARDGETYRPHWDRWAAQEAVHLERDAPRELATIVVDVP